MKRKNLWSAVVMTAFLWFGNTANVNAAETTDLADYVNPLVGTQSTFKLSTGNTYPAIARPWGMNFWTPDRKSVV